MCSKVTIKIPERRQWRRSGISIVNFEHISHLCSSVSIVNFEQVNAGWEAFCSNRQTSVSVFVKWVDVVERSLELVFPFSCCPVIRECEIEEKPHSKKTLTCSKSTIEALKKL